MQKVFELLFLSAKKYFYISQKKINKHKLDDDDIRSLSLLFLTEKQRSSEPRQKKYSQIKAYLLK